MTHDQKPKKRPVTEPVQFRFDPNVCAELRKEAQADDRTFSYVVASIFAKGLKVHRDEQSKGVAA